MKITIQNSWEKPGMRYIILAALFWSPTLRLLLSHSLNSDRGALAATDACGCDVPWWFASLRETMMLSIAMEHFFEESFVGEGRQVIFRPEFVQQRHCHAPRHPLPRHVLEVPATPQKSFNYFNLRFRQAVEIGCKWDAFERTPQRQIGDWRREYLSKDRRLCFAFTHHDSAGKHIAHSLIARTDKNRNQAN